ncbi:uncharacterized protein MELLADRAFT_93485 [Melampsora larici-populina 98AG31]|uniref:PABS domain-containing protein n=1 Tax=Melampsora larici-populina (strain 98AG31 / pathotype 3-4-7) TaxID=747676 RepID=F4RAK0_MELLP|nr:uncharacterized protein MELLADRAFT_93485 [Melampsora larici-populina 98AG31]EGG10495.1 hypothetical protein MELLADRAFT_93485 [Melampsora larici-populina 98AG31]
MMILMIYKTIPVSQSLCKDEPTNQTKSATNLLVRRISTTGLITVGEFKDPESREVFRYLRSDHSLLGGIWIGPSMKSVQKKFSNLNQIQLEKIAIENSESIYSTFIIQEAIRLVKRNQTHSKKQEEEALIMEGNSGLGIGVSAKTLMKHSIKTTIVEIDPTVYKYAREYFGMIQPNGGIYLEDIRVYLNRNLANDESKDRQETVMDKFDYVIHDVFTGGMVPADLFVKSFWIDLKKVLKIDGVLVINFAGLPSSRAGLMVLLTIFDVFSFCRTFSEKDFRDQNPEELEFQNLVFFCKMNEVPEFRPVTKSDVLNSNHKFWILNRLMNHELTEVMSSILLKHQDLKEEMVLKEPKDSIKLKLAQIPSALNHWNVMRELLDEKTWENYY